MSNTAVISNVDLMSWQWSADTNRHHGCRQWTRHVSAGVQRWVPVWSTVVTYTHYRQAGTPSQLPSLPCQQSLIDDDASLPAAQQCIATDSKWW